MGKTEAQTVTLTTTDPNAEGYIVMTQTGDTWTLSMPNALAFDEQGYPYSYFLTETAAISPASGTTTPTGTVYQPEYLNQNNYSSLMDALYSGGTVTNTLTNTTTFQATKVWKDDNQKTTIANRPTATVELYRYPDDGKNYESASPVAGATTEDIDKTVESFTVTLPTDNSTLPMYNAAGYRYVYFVKETLTGAKGDSYRQSFKNNGSLDGSNKFLFNGGELDNIITGEVNRDVVKTWVAKAHQDIDAKVTVTLTQTDPDTKAEKIFKQEITGFGAEITTKTASFTGLPKYNDEGHLYTYSAEETDLKVKVDGKFEATTKKDGTDFVTADGYRYRQSTTTNSATGTETITNQLIGNAEVEIHKTFPNGLLASPTTLTYTIYRNGTAIGTKTVSYTGTKDGASFTPDIITIQKYEDLTLTTGTSGSGLLPRYDENGVQYKYTVQETGITPANTYGTTTGNSFSEGTYDAAVKDYAGEKYLLANASISNYKPVEGMSIRVNKVWLDDGGKMYHEPVHAVLQYSADGTTWTNVAEGVIPITADYVDIGVPKTVPAGSTGTATYRDLYKKWIDNSKPSAGAGVFRVVETALGSSKVTADADVNRTAHPEHVSGNGFVSTGNQNYDVLPTETNGDYEFTVTNRRVGVEKITATKTWVDGENENNTRPDSITFTVTASQAVFKTGGTTTTAQEYTLTLPNQTLSTEWLPKYDVTGVLITYTIEETELNYSTTGKDYSSLYAHSSKHDSYTVGDKHTGDQDDWEFTNSLTGTVKPLMNKYWMDLGDAATIAARPDIYPLLFRTYTDSNKVTHVEKMTYQDRDWNTDEITKNWWQCTFVAQPRYNEEGYEYTYYVGEAYSSANHGDYVCSGAYADAPDSTDGSFSEKTASGSAKQKVTLTYDNTKYAVAKLDNATGSAGTVVNRPEAKRTVSGTKVWTNLPAKFQKTYLPTVTFTLYRYEYGQEENTAAAVIVAEKTVTVDLNSGENSFAFPEKYDRYDSVGKPYTYVVKETAPSNIDYTYQMTDNTANGLVVTNHYKDDQGFAVTFTKTWSGIPAGSKLLPTSTITLVRYLTSDGTKVIDGTREDVFAARETNTYDNAVSITPANASTIETKVTWDKLAYYGPNGEPYQYRVEETSVPNGWTVYGDDGKTPVTKTASGAYEAVVSGRYTNPTTTTSGIGTGSAKLTNKYGDVTGSITVKKEWANDITYAISPRPTSISLQLYRSPVTTAATVTTEAVGDPITLNKDPWSAVINDLQVYAPDGMQYSYSLKEVSIPTGYTAAYSPAAITLKIGDTVNLTAKNTAQTTKVVVSKTQKFVVNQVDRTPENWQTLFASKLSAVPSSIKVHFQYSTDNGASWSLLQNKDESTVEKTIKLQSGGAFDTAQAATLPTEILVGTEIKDVIYRAFEYSVTYANGTTVTRSSMPGSGVDTDTIGALTTTGMTTTASGTYTTALTNSLPMEPITITKKWADEDNRDGERPTSVTFTVTRTGVESASDTAAAQVTLTSSDKLANDADTWSKTWYVPVYRNDSNTEKSTYTVTETAAAGYTAAVGTDGSVWTAAGSSIDVSLGDTSAASTAWFKNSKNHETFTIQPAKEWRWNGAPVSNADLSWYKSYFPGNLTFTLQAEEVEGSKVTKPWADIDSTEFNGDFTGISKTITGTVDSATGVLTVGSWTGLPKYATDSDVANRSDYHYRIVETQSKTEQKCFTAAYSSSDLNASAQAVNSTATLTAMNTLVSEPVTATKSWTDSNNAYNTRPDHLIFTVQQSADSGTTYTDYNPTGSSVVVINAVVGTTGALTANTVNVPKYRTDGTEYQYQAVESKLVYGTTEIQVADTSIYTAATTDGRAFTNTLLSTSLTAKKNWTDGQNKYGLRPAKITFKVQQSTDNGTTFADYKPAGTTGTTVTFTADVDSSTGALTSNTLSGLPRTSANGSVTYQYRAVEESFTFTGSTAAVNRITDTTNGDRIGAYRIKTETTTGTSAEGFTTAVTNTLITTSVSATKVWDDTASKAVTRPDTVTLHLLRDNTEQAAEVKTINNQKQAAATGTLVTWSDLPVYNASGTAYAYSVQEDVPAGYLCTTTGTQAGGYTLTNTAASLTLNKKDAADQTLLAGAQFSITPAEGKTFADGTTAAKTLLNGSSDTSASIAGQLIAGVAYTFTETTTPAGYITMNPFTVTIGTDGKMTVTSGDDNSASGSTTGSGATAVRTVTAQNTKNSLTVTKNDANGKPLAGTTFTLSGVDGALFAKATGDIVWTTSTTNPTNNPYPITGELKVGSIYKLTETTPAGGYTTASDRYLKMDADGVLLESNQKDTGYAEVSGNALVVSDVQNGFNLTKTGANGESLVGTTFTLTKYSATTPTTPVVTWQISDNKILSHDFTGVMTADTVYRLSETVPAPGYKTAADLYLKMSKAGQLQRSDTADGTYTDVADNKLTVADVLDDLVLVKQKNTETHELISGAQFTLTGVFEDGKAEETKTLSPTAAAAADLKGMLIADNTYLLKETVPGNGTVLTALNAKCNYSDAQLTADGAMNVKVTTAGVLQYETTDNNWTAFPDNRILVKDDENLLAVQKRNADGTTALTATVTISGVFADGTGTETRTLLNSAADGSMTGKLIAGNTYTIKETVPPAGYTVFSEFTITVNKDGSIVPAAHTTLPAGVSIDTQTKHTITMKDTANALTIAKEDQFSRNVPGAVLELLKPDGTAEVSWNTSDTNANPKSLTGVMTAGTEYTLHEATTPAVYQTAADVVLRMTSDGKLQRKDGTNWNDVTANTVTITDVLSLTQASLTKTDENGKALEGTQFSLYKKGAGTAGADLLILAGIAPVKKSGSTAAVWITSDAADTVMNPDTGLKLNLGLANGTYYYQETAAKAGYQLDSSHHEFTVTNQTNGTTAAVTVQNVPLVIHLLKQSEGGSALAGAEFSLYREDGTLAGKGVTDKAGKLDFTNLTWGVYKLKETAAPGGYQTVETFQVMLAQDGTLTAAGKTALPGSVKLSGSTITVKDTLIPPSNSGSLTFTKLVSGFETGYAGAKNVPAAGVTFGIFTDAACTVPYRGHDTKTNADTPAEVTSGADGTVTFDGIAAGTYYIRETAVPANVLLSKAVYQVTAQSNGSAAKMTAVGSDTEVTQIVDDIARGSVDVVKVDALDHAKKLSGAEYQLYRVGSDASVAASYQNKTAVSGTKTLVETGVTDAKGGLHFTGLLTGVTYVLTETAPADGSQVSENSVRFAFQVSKNGTTVLTGLDDGSGTVTKNADGSLTWQEAPTEVTVAKVDNSGTLVDGAVLQITDRDGNVVVPDWTTSGREPKVLNGVLNAGETYVLTEVSTPEGFETAKPVTFTVEAKKTGSDQNSLKEAVQIVFMVDLRPNETLEFNPTAAGAMYSPQTGDYMQPIFWAGLCAAAGAGALVLRKKKHED